MQIKKECEVPYTYSLKLYEAKNKNDVDIMELSATITKLYLILEKIILV